MVNSSGRDDFTYPRRWVDPTAAFNGRALENYLREVGWTVVETNLRSANWDGGNALPSDSATSGFFLDAQSGSAQFAGSMYIGGETVLDGNLDVAGDITMSSGGVFASGAAAPRWIFDIDNYDQHDFVYETDATHEYAKGSLNATVVDTGTIEEAGLYLISPTLGDATNRGWGQVSVFSDYAQSVSSIATLEAQGWGTWDSRVVIKAAAWGSGTADILFKIGNTTVASLTGEASGFFTTEVVRANNEVQLGDGSAADPSLTFINDGNTGFYRTAGQLIATVSSSWRWVVTASKFETGSGVTISSGDNGTVSLPGITFSSDTNTGFYRVVNNYMAVSAGGYIMQQWGWSGTAKDIYLYGLTGAGATGRPYVRYTSADGKLYYDSSSIDLKENIRPLWSDTCRFMELQPSMFDYKDGSGDNQIGLIAEWVYDVYPELGIWGPPVNDYREEGDEPLPEKIIDWDRSGLQSVMVDELQKLIRRVELLEGAV